MQIEQIEKCSQVREFTKMMIDDTLLRERFSSYCDKNFYEWVVGNSIRLGEKMYGIEICLPEKIKIYNEFLDIYLPKQTIKVGMAKKVENLI